MTDEGATYSISLRLQRVTTEECFVSVPVTDAVMQDEPYADGSWHLDLEKLWAEAIRLGEVQGGWRVEERQTAPHPVQTAPGPPAAN